jgi:anti-sigma regulatory factor (Ser/Thr protein kinase)
VIATYLASSKQNWSTVSFASTLYLCPILDLLLTGIPVPWQAEIRLGLQEALVNAAKHGNRLDPSKTVSVRYSIRSEGCWWAISDQGTGVDPFNCCDGSPTGSLPDFEHECGRGLYILHQVFDQVTWNHERRELKLSKQVKNASRPPLLC